MSDVAGIILHTILQNPDESHSVWSKLKPQHFKLGYSDIYASILKYYDKFETLPSFETLSIYNRDNNLVKKIKALELLEVPENLDMDVVVEALLDQHTQETILDGLTNFVEKISHYDKKESVEKLSDLVLKVEEEVSNPEEVYLMNDLFLMEEEELLSRIPLGLNNTMDIDTGGMSTTELVMLGGHRGSGKTVAACNITTNQYKNGKCALFFTIEMRAKEINARFMSILSGVPNSSIKNQRCSPEQIIKVAKTRADFFMDSEEVFQDYLSHKDYKKFELDLNSSKQLKSDNQIMMVDNSFLTLMDIDVNIQKAKAKYGDALNTVVVDYVNQIVIADMYDWKSQIQLSKRLKDLANKYDVLMVTPYQTDTTGEARFSKGLLDSADLALNLHNEGEYLKFVSTKTRGTPGLEFNSPIDWPTLAISQEDYIIDTNEEGGESAKDLSIH